MAKVDNKLDIAWSLLVKLVHGMKCEYCGKKLSTYNENRFCFVHIYKGYQSDQQAEDERRQKNAKIMAKSRERAKI